ncbi:MAG: hypothetical protein ABFC67_09145 [Mizugakiibacter sp.]|uniref:hypothetical protein n=1 Tax=Mizugakiibacter sp. TaxID=1972610 RepID=UPI0031C6E5CE|nr:hypothetical protein [Xanthomonadaceae bacterium]
MTWTSARAAAWLLAGAAVLGGCRHADVRVDPPNRGDVSYRALVDPAQSRYVLEPQQSFSKPEPVDHPAPPYPAELLPLRLPPQAFAAKVIVGADGRVADVRMLVAPGASAPPHADAFATAIRRTVMAWTYTPLRIVTWVDSDHGAKVQRVETLPFSLDYAFTFAVQNGQPVVTNAAK